MLRLHSMSMTRSCSSNQRFADRCCHLIDFLHPDSVRRLHSRLGVERRRASDGPWLPFVACATEHLEPADPSLAH